MNSASTIARGFLSAVVALSFLSSSLAAEEENVLFFDDFEGADIDEHPTIPPWTEVSEFGDDAIRVREDSEDYFGKGVENRFLEYADYGDDPAILWANEVIEEEHEVVTFSMSFYEPAESGQDGPLVIFLYSGEPGHGTRVERLRMNNGGFFAGPPSEGNEQYEVDAVHRLDWVVNNSGADFVYSNGHRVLAPGYSDIWVDGSLVWSNYQFEGHDSGAVRGFDIRTFSGDRQTIYIDEVVVSAGAAVGVELPEPLIEFRFDGDLVNTGSLGGEASFNHPREDDGVYDYEFENYASLGEGLLGEPESGLDNAQVGGMGDYGQGDTREGGIYYQPGEGLHDLESITIASWYKTLPEDSWEANARMMHKPGAMDLYAGINRVAFNPLTTGNEARSQFSGPTPWQQESDRWIFFAVTFDAETGTMSFYRADEDSDGVTLDVSRTVDPGSIRNVGFDVAIANSYFATRPFRGYVDNFRIFASSEDSSGVLSQGELEAFWAADLADPSEPPEPVDAFARIVNFEHEGFNVLIEFESEDGQNYSVEYKDDLGDEGWQPLQAVTGTGDVVSVNDWGPLPDRRFYRVRLTE